MLILFGFRSIFISLPLPTVCEEREFTFLTVRLMLDVLSKYSYSFLEMKNVKCLAPMKSGDGPRLVKKQLGVKYKENELKIQK